MANRYLDFQCSSCLYEEQDVFTKESTLPCPKCGASMEIVWHKAPVYGDPYRLGVTKPPSDFDKYVLGKIKAKFPGSTIGEKRQLAREI